jgi:ion channel-forming bestrophin family protein
MIVYDTKNWGNTLIKIYLSFNKAYTTRVLFRDIFYLTIYTAIIVVVDIEFLDKPLHIDTMFFSLLGFILSLMLVFRLNSSYSKWWEGRTAWGALINNSRTLSSNLHAIIPKTDKETRRYFAIQISNFAYALQGHLRDNVNFDELEKLDDQYFNQLKKAKHVPHKIATMLFEKMEEKVKEGIFSESDKLNLKVQMQNILEVLGICERIKNTPIPFSHNSYIKTFILVYIFSLPFGIVGSLGYYTIPTMALIAYALVGVEFISEEVEEPFGKQANDLPLLHLSSIIKDNVFEALEVEYSLKVPSIELDNKYILIIH